MSTAVVPTHDKSTIPPSLVAKTFFVLFPFFGGGWREWCFCCFHVNIKMHVNTACWVSQLRCTWLAWIHVQKHLFVRKYSQLNTFLTSCLFTLCQAMSRHGCSYIYCKDVRGMHFLNLNDQRSHFTAIYFLSLTPASHG